jgi:potassium efflux system protein
MFRVFLPLLFACTTFTFTSHANARQELEDQHSELRSVLKTLGDSVSALPEDDASKPGLQQRVSALQASLDQCELDKKESQRLTSELQNAEATAKELDSKIESAKGKDVDTQKVDDSDLAALNKSQLDIQAEIARIRAEQSQLERTMAGMQKVERISAELKEIESQMESASAAAQANDDGSLAGKLASLEADVTRHRLTSRRNLLQLRQQAATVYAQFDLNQKRKDLLAIQLAIEEAKAKTIGEAVAKWRQQEAKAQAAQATDKAFEIQKDFPQLKLAEEENVTIAKKVEDLEVEAAETQQRDRKLQQQLIDIASKFTDTRSKIKDIGRSNTVGAMLRKRKSELPSSAQQQQQAFEARERIEEIQFERFQISEQLASLSANSIFDELAESDVELKEGDREKLAKPVENLIERRRESLRSLDKIYGRLFDDHIEIETVNNRVAKLVGQFNEYINERILWLRSNNVLFSEWKIDKADSALWNADKWSGFGNAVLSRVKKRPILFSLVTLIFAGLITIRPRLRKEVDELGAIAERGSCATFWPTGRAALLTALIAIKIPLFVFLVGHLLGRLTNSGNPIFDATAHALQIAGLFAIPIELLRRACRPNGLATKHFDWSNLAVAKLKRNLGWYVVPASLLVYAVSFFIQLDSAHRVDLIERTLFVIAMVLTTWVLWRIFSPSHGIFSEYLTRNENSWAHQTSIVWFTLVLLVPISLGILAVAGYYYTAVNLTRCLCFSFAFAVGIELIRALIRRFVLVRRRAAHIEKARRKREAEIEAAREARKKAAEERQRRIEAGEDVEEFTTPVMTSESLADLQFENIDIDENAGQANQLIRLLGWTAWLLGLWLVWSDVLPAMKALDEYKLWGTSTLAAASDSDLATTALLPGSSVAAPATNGDEPPRSREPVDQTSEARNASPLIDLDSPKSDGVSLRDFLVFIAIVLLTFFAARNLPNAFEMLFLEELPVDRSARYASKALFSYAIVIIGTMLALRTLSINWTSIQWLVTALTFGLAFGLQEIFANFVAGIILMFERPMRIGDLITVDDFTGVVTRIRTRATTIVNWDRKEYVIPNKDFITGRLVNWTLSDAINRIQFTVGIAYGSDVAKAKKIIFDICQEHPSIVDDPPTSITFEEFADSSLNLCIRTFLGTVDSRLPVIDSLHTRINNAFNEAGIEISFPQRDLNLRTIDAEAADLLATRGRSKNES